MSNTKKYKRIVEPLVKYTCEKLSYVTPDKLFLIRVTYEIIREAIADLHHGSIKAKEECVEYFKSSQFAYDCKILAIDKSLMLFIAYNPNKYLDKLQPYIDEEAEENEGYL